MGSDSSLQSTKLIFFQQNKRRFEDYNSETEEDKEDCQKHSTLMICYHIDLCKFVVYSVGILFAMCTIKLQNMSCFITVSLTLIVLDKFEQATKFSVQCAFYNSMFNVH